MEIPVLAVAAYLAAMVLAARYLLVLPSGQEVSVGMGALLVIFLLFWPVWAPVVAFHRLKARRAEPAYLERIAELDGLIAQDEALGLQIDELLEQLAVAGDDPQTLDLLADLAARTQAREDTRDRAAEVRKDARDIRSRGLQWSSPGLPEISTINFQEEAEPHNTEGVSRVRLHLSSDTDEGDDWDLEPASRRLREHLLGLFLPVPDGPPLSYPSIKYKRATPARSKSWETVITSSFRKSLRRAGNDIEQRTMTAIEELVINPVEPRGNTIKRLAGNRKGLWRYRIGDFRLIYQPLVEQGELRLISLTHRGQAY